MCLAPKPKSIVARTVEALICEIQLSVQVLVPFLL